MSFMMRVTESGRVPRLRWAEAARAWGEEAAPMGMRLLRAHTPVGYGPNAGALRQSERWRISGQGGALTVLFYTQAKYARYVIEGTRPHPIPRNGTRLLRWTDRAGNVSYAMRVNHPGTRPNPFPERALASLRPALAHLFERCVREATGLG